MKDKKISFETINLPKVKATKILIGFVEDGIISIKQFDYLQIKYQEYIATFKFLKKLPQRTKSEKIIAAYLIRGLDLVLFNDMINSEIDLSTKSYFMNICNAGKKRIK